MSDKSPWGPIITSEEEDEEDPIRKMLKMIEDIKIEEIKKGDTRTLKEIQESKNARINMIEKKISDMLYARKTRRLLS